MSEGYQKSPSNPLDVATEADQATMAQAKLRCIVRATVKDAMRSCTSTLPAVSANVALHALLAVAGDLGATSVDIGIGQRAPHDDHVDPLAQSAFDSLWKTFAKHGALHMCTGGEPEPLTKALVPMLPGETLNAALRRYFQTLRDVHDVLNLTSDYREHERIVREVKDVALRQRTHDGRASDLHAAIEREKLGQEALDEARRSTKYLAGVLDRIANIVADKLQPAYAVDRDRLVLAVEALKRAHDAQEETLKALEEVKAQPPTVQDAIDQGRALKSAIGPGFREPSILGDFAVRVREARNGPQSWLSSRGITMRFNAKELARVVGAESCRKNAWFSFQVVRHAPEETPPHDAVSLEDEVTLAKPGPFAVRVRRSAKARWTWMHTNGERTTFATLAAASARARARVSHDGGDAQGVFLVDLNPASRAYRKAANVVGVTRAKKGAKR